MAGLETCMAIDRDESDVDQRRQRNGTDPRADRVHGQELA
jgi:hypothetical protein